MNNFIIREAISEDADAIWGMLQHAIQGGDVYYFYPNSNREEMMPFWLSPEKRAYVVTNNDQVVGTFWIRDNAPGLGSHIANAGYLSHPNERGQGIGRLMGEYSIKEAKRLGYQAMQFNFVVKSNEGAVRLWKKIGFEVIGEIPNAFQHQELGLTNAYIMYRTL